jgi:hypothetical protein
MLMKYNTNQLNASRRAKENQYSRAYICFHTVEQMAAFHKGFDGHLFIDSKGIITALNH